MTVEPTAMPYGWSPSGVPMHIAEAPDGATLFAEGQPEGAVAFWETIGIPYRPNLVPEFCQARVGDLQCRGRKAQGTDFCIGHIRAGKADPVKIQE